METLEEIAGQVGALMAHNMSTKAINAVADFPASSPAQKAAIAKLVAEDLMLAASNWELSQMEWDEQDDN